MDPILNVFEGDAFSFTTMVESINKLPFVPGRIGELGVFKERGIATTSVSFEEQYGQLNLIDPTPRGGPGQTSPKNARKGRMIRVPHYQHDDAIKAEEVQNVREFGQNTGTRSVESFVADRMEIYTNKMDATLEYQRMGALNGQIIDSAGNIVVDLFAEFNVPQPAAIAFQLSSATANLRQTSAKVARTMMRNLGGTAVGGVMALCGDNFWDALITHPKVEQTYVYQEGTALRKGIAYQSLTYGGIMWENYRGYIAPVDGGADDGSSAVPFIPANECRFFPINVPNLFFTYFAPADYQETVNTIGLPRYAKAIPSRNGKAVELEMQMKPQYAGLEA